MTFSLAGYHPKTKEPKIYAIHIPDDAKQEVEERARGEGWTGLTWSRPGPKDTMVEQIDAVGDGDEDVRDGAAGD